MPAITGPLLRDYSRRMKCSRFPRNFSLFFLTSVKTAYVRRQLQEANFLGCAAGGCAMIQSIARHACAWQAPRRGVIGRGSLSSNSGAFSRQGFGQSNSRNDQQSTANSFLMPCAFHAGEGLSGLAEASVAGA